MAFHAFGEVGSMRTISLEVRPGRGMGDLLFGLTEPELVGRLGPPDRQYRTGSGILRLQYFAHRTEFAIEAENRDRFGWVEVWNPVATFAGQLVVGEQVDDVVLKFTTVLGEEPEHEDYDSFETYFFRENWVELHVRFGHIECLNWGVLYDKSEEPRWPVS